MPIIDWQTHARFASRAAISNSRTRRRRGPSPCRRRRGRSGSARRPTSICSATPSLNFSKTSSTSTWFCCSRTPRRSPLARSISSSPSDSAMSNARSSTRRTAGGRRARPRSALACRAPARRAPSSRSRRSGMVRQARELLVEDGARVIEETARGEELGLLERGFELGSAGLRRGVLFRDGVDGQADGPVPLRLQLEGDGALRAAVEREARQRALGERIVDVVAPRSAAPRWPRGCSAPNTSGARRPPDRSPRGRRTGAGTSGS